MTKKIKSDVQESLKKIENYEIEEEMRLCNANSEDLTIVNKIVVVSLAYKYSEFESFAETETYIKKNIADKFTQKKLLNTLEKFHKAIDELSRKYRRKELKEKLFEISVDRIDERGGEWQDLPDSLTSLILDLLNIKDDEKFLQLNTSTFKIPMNVAKNEKISVCGICESQNSLCMGIVRSAVVDNRMEVKSGKTLESETFDIQADKVLVTPPYGRLNSNDIVSKKLNNFCERICCREWAYTVAGILNQKSGGVTFAILPENVLVNEADKDIRKKLIDSGKVAGIISLPKYDAFQRNLVIFTENNTSVKMLDAREIFQNIRYRTEFNDNAVKEILKQYNSGDSENFIEVPNDKIAANDYAIYPARYLVEEKIDFDGVTLSNFVTSIQRGAQQIRPNDLNALKSDIPTDYQFLNIQDISETGINKNLIYLKEEAYSKYQNNFVSAGDIVISKISPFKSAIIPDNNKKILISGNLYALKVADDVNPNWLLLCLKNPKILMQLNAMAIGGISKIINPRNLNEIKIPKVSFDNQNQIAKEYSSLIGEMENLSLKIEEIRDKIKNLIAV